jgi:hypothetical protein
VKLQIRKSSARYQTHLRSLPVVGRAAPDDMANGRERKMKAHHALVCSGSFAGQI